MGIGDLAFIAWFLFSTGYLLATLVQLLRGRRRSAWKHARIWAGVVGGYLSIVVIVSLLAPARRISQGETWRFDHWGVAVEHVAAFAIPRSADDRETETRALAVTLRVSNDARRARQRAAQAGVSLVTESGEMCEVSAVGQEAYESSHGRQTPLTAELSPEASFTTVRVFEVPRNVNELGLVVFHGAWVGWFLIGGENSLLHAQTLIELRVPARDGE